MQAAHKQLSMALNRLSCCEATVLTTMLNKSILVLGVEILQVLYVCNKVT